RGGTRPSPHRCRPAPPGRVVLPRHADVRPQVTGGRAKRRDRLHTLTARAKLTAEGSSLPLPSRHTRPERPKTRVSHAWVDSAAPDRPASASARSRLVELPVNGLDYAAVTADVSIVQQC